MNPQVVLLAPSNKILIEYLADAYGADLQSFPSQLNFLSDTERREFNNSLPLAGNLVQLSSAIVEYLSQRNMINEHFFGYLYNTRARRHGEIRSLSRAFNIDRQSRTVTITRLCPNAILALRYRLIHPVGVGGFGTVWQATDLRDNSHVALKFLHGGDTAVNEDRRIRFFRGALKVASLNHPGIAKVLVPQCCEDGHDFYVMEYVDGRTLYDAVRQDAPNHARHIHTLLQIGEALSAAHAQGVIHRDIKPQNIMVTRSEKRNSDIAKLIDFDLVRDLESHFTQTGALGTRMYAAPEIYTSGRADHRSDMFGLAMTALFILYGKELPPEAYTTVQRGQRKFLRSFIESEKMIAVLDRAMQWKPEDRFPTIFDFCTQLKVALEDRTPKTSKFKFWAILSVTAIGLFLVGLGLLTSLTTDPPLTGNSQSSNLQDESNTQSTQPAHGDVAQAEEAVSDAADKKTPLPTEPPVLSETVKVTINSTPSRTKIFILDSDKIPLPVSSGRMFILERKPGLLYQAEHQNYKTQTGKIEFDELDHLLIDISLKKQPLPKTAELKIGSGPGCPPATVWVDGVKQAKTTPVSVMVSPGQHSIKWIYPNASFSTKRVTTADKSTQVIKGDNTVRSCSS